MYLGAYCSFHLEVGSVISDIACAIALLEFLDHLAGLASVLELVEALFTIDILLNWGYK